MRLQNAAPRTSHRLWRCQVVLTIRLFYDLLEIEFSEFEFFLYKFQFLSSTSFEFLSFVAIISWVMLLFDFWQKISLKFCYNLSFFFSFVTTLVFEFRLNWVFNGQNLSLWVQSQLKLFFFLMKTVFLLKNKVVKKTIG